MIEVDSALNVELGERSYPIYIGDDLLSNTFLLQKCISSEQVIIVTNETIAPLYLDKLLSALHVDHLHHIVLPDGEQYKNLDSMRRIYDELIALKCNRDVSLVALGGGVIGDMTGFAAATYQRGVKFVQLPTTLLAQVDSSVGGKTGVNHPGGKNMIGAFYQPGAVVIDLLTLQSLPDREYRAGLAEVIKYGLISDLPFLKWLNLNMDKLLQRDSEALHYAIQRSCECKAKVVAEDEKEAGLRAILNFGHTFGHAIETATHYNTWLHGEAVGFGMSMALDFSQKLGYLSEQENHFAKSIIIAAGLPQSIPNDTLGVDQMLDLMALDKKVSRGELRLVLLRGLGDAMLTSDFDPLLLRESMSFSLCV